jgi:flagellar hook-associated protein 2
MADSLTASLLNTVSASNALSGLFSTSGAFANPEALAETAQAVLAFRNQFPSDQVLALSGLHTQLGALATAALPLLQPSPQANSLLLSTNSPALQPNLYQQVSVSSSDSGVSVTARAGATQTSYQVGVSQLAVAQQDTSAAFTSATANNAAGGTSINLGTGGVGSLRITMNGATADASYNVPTTLDSEDALTTVAEAINSITNNNALQTVTLNNARSGTFTLSFGGQTTASIAVGASAATVKADLAALSTVGAAANVTVGKSGNSYTIGFTGALTGQPLPQLLAGSSLNSSASITVESVGPTASVSTSSGSSTLVVTAGAAGSSGAFSLSDVTGDGIAQTSANTVTTSAQDAIYTLNGTTYRATEGNSATLDSGNVTLTFADTTSSDATVSVSSDTSSLTSAVTNLATAYNNLQTYLSDNSTFFAPELAQRAQNIITANAAGLASIGVTGSTSLAVNQTTLDDASASTIQSVLAGQTGVATQLSQLSSVLLQNLESPQAAAPESQSNNAEVATGLARFYQQLLLANQGLGSNLSIKA